MPEVRPPTIDVTPGSGVLGHIGDSEPKNARESPMLEPQPPTIDATPTPRTDPFAAVDHSDLDNRKSKPPTGPVIGVASRTGKSRGGGGEGGSDKPRGGHRTQKSRSTRERHQTGDERRLRDQGREKGDKRRPYQRREMLPATMLAIAIANTATAISLAQIGSSMASHAVETLTPRMPSMPFGPASGSKTANLAPVAGAGLGALLLIAAFVVVL
jgi:hypothetical protein